MNTNESISRRWDILQQVLDERQRRLWLAVEAQGLGYGGVAVVAAATGVTRNTISTGLAELGVLEAGGESGLPLGRVRRAGAGRKRVEDQDARVVDALLALVESGVRGDPESPLRWTNKSLRKLSEELKAQGHAVSHTLVGHLLKAQGFSLQANSKMLEGKQSPDRDAQFEHIEQTVMTAQAAQQPVISVDTKKKELVGAYKNAGQEWHPGGTPVKVKVHDFIDPDLGRANPYGVYDLAANDAWVSVGTDHDTSAFAVQSIRRWWETMGKERYPQAHQLVITADGGGSNSSRGRLWKLELSRLAQEIGLNIEVCHFPPGTSKWNKIEHRLFSQITLNWRGRPLTSHEVIVNLIANTRTHAGLSVRAELDTALYPKGVEVTDAQFAAIPIERNAFHGEWNYCIKKCATDLTPAAADAGCG